RLLAIRGKTGTAIGRRHFELSPYGIATQLSGAPFHPAAQPQEKLRVWLAGDPCLDDFKLVIEGNEVGAIARRDRSQLGLQAQKWGRGARGHFQGGDTCKR